MMIEGHVIIAVVLLSYRHRHYAINNIEFHVIITLTLNKGWIVIISSHFFDEPISLNGFLSGIEAIFFHH